MARPDVAEAMTATEDPIRAAVVELARKIADIPVPEIEGDWDAGYRAALKDVSDALLSDDK